jgi:outer membrane protein OmpA-like peptidoglycan-associated protein
LLWGGGAAWAQALPTPSQDDMRALFDVPIRASTKAFRMTAAPSQDGLCAGQMAKEAKGGGAHKTLEVVAYEPEPRPHLDLPIQFDFSSDKILPPSKTLLDQLAAVLNEPDKRESTFAVAGHTDPSGDEGTNKRLSCARALAVKGYLVSKGVAAGRLSAYGFGSARPLADAPGPEALRRVELRRAQ